MGRPGKAIGDLDERERHQKTRPLITRQTTHLSATATPFPAALSSATLALADNLAGDCSHTCDGDWVTVAWGGGGGGRHNAATAADPPALTSAAASAFSGGRFAGGVNKSTCYGTFSAHWSKGEASGCAKCVGTMTILRAPCGARVVSCDGLLHHYGSAPHPGTPGKTAWHGTGALGVSVMVRAPPRREEQQEGGSDHGLDRSHGKNDEPAWHAAARFSSDGMWGEGWALKDGGGSAALPDPATPAFAAAARAALKEVGVSLPSNAGWAVPGEGGRGLLRRTLAALSPAFARTPVSGGSPAITCNGAPLNPLLPCVGDLEIVNHPTGGHGHLDGSCHGLWSPLHICKGLAMTHLIPEEEDGEEGAACGMEGAPQPCPSHWSLRRQCDGKMGAYPKVGGVGIWCTGRTSGAVLVKEGGGSRHRHRHQAEVVVD